MKKAYSLIINKSMEVIKLILLLLLILFYNSIYELLVIWLNKQFTLENILYISRLFYIVLFCTLAILVKFRFKNFVKKNWESLILTGLGVPKCFLLFLFSNYSALFIMFYFGSMLCQIIGINVFFAIIQNAVLVYVLGVLMELKICTKVSSFSTYIIVCILAVLVGTKTLTYGNIYNIIMSNTAKQILFSCSILSFILKFVFSTCLLFVTVYQYRKTGIEPMVLPTHLHRRNQIGDVAHKLSKYSMWDKNYSWLYRSKDFVIWKIFSSIVFLFISFTINNNFAVFLSGYSIILVSTFYYYDIYNFERSLLLYYYMSTYSYEKLIRDIAIYSILILGDNILIILLIRSFFHPSSFLILFIILLSIIFSALFTNSQLYVKYPLKQYNIIMCLAIIKMHIPILNIIFLFINLKQGKKNWENLDNV